MRRGRVIHEGTPCCLVLLVNDLMWSKQSHDAKRTRLMSFSSVLCQPGLPKQARNILVARKQAGERAIDSRLSGKRTPSLEPRVDRQVLSKEAADAQREKWVYYGPVAGFQFELIDSLRIDGAPETPCRDQKWNLLRGASTQRCQFIQIYKQSTSSNHADVLCKYFMNSARELLRVNRQIYPESSYMFCETRERVAARRGERVRSEKENENER
ncbi:hypothetical protein MMC22_007177 [Lobaria immixta]|nr:hypothetical protein [Lobaria immixta]